MKKLGIIWLLSLTVISLSSCRKDINGPNNVIIDQQRNLVALTAVYNERYSEMGANIEKLVLVDYFNPTNYKVLTDSSFRPWWGKFTHDKSKIIFGDAHTLHTAEDLGYQFFIYDVKDSTFQTFGEFEGGHFPLCGIKPFWNHDGTGFYFTTYPPPFSFSKSVLFFDITMEKGWNIVNSKSWWSAVSPEALIDENTLIVFSNDSLVTGQPPGFYLMDINGNYLSRVNNPHLLGRSKSGMLIRARCIDWNNRLKLLLYAEAIQTIHITYKISVTNLDGTYYRNYTSGEYDDLYPVWGPDVKTIIFERTPLIHANEYTHRKIMILNVETGEVRDFISPSCINGAISLRFPDY